MAIHWWTPFHLKSAASRKAASCSCSKRAMVLQRSTQISGMMVYDGGRGEDEGLPKLSEMRSVESVEAHDFRRQECQEKGIEKATRCSKPKAVISVGPGYQLICVISILNLCDSPRVCAAFQDFPMISHCNCCTNWSQTSGA